MKLRLGRIAFDTRPIAPTDGVPEEVGLQESEVSPFVWVALTRRGFVDGSWRALVAASLLPLAAQSAFADDDDDEGGTGGGTGAGGGVGTGAGF